MSLNRKSLVLGLTLAVCSIVAAPAPSAEMMNRIEKHSKNLDWLVEHPTIQKLLELHNQERARNGLAPSTLNPEMCLAAQKHAVWMAETGWFQHSGLPYLEIIYHGLPTPELTVQGWIASPPHHSIIISGATRVGFGYQLRGGYPYWVGVFRCQ